MHPHHAFGEEGILQRVQGAVFDGQAMGVGAGVEVDHLGLALGAISIAHRQVLEDEIVAVFEEAYAAAADGADGIADNRFRGDTCAGAVRKGFGVGIGQDGRLPGGAMDRHIRPFSQEQRLVVSPGCDFDGHGATCRGGMAERALDGAEVRGTVGRNPQDRRIRRGSLDGKFDFSLGDGRGSRDDALVHGHIVGLAEFRYAAVEFHSQRLALNPQRCIVDDAIALAGAEPVHKAVVGGLLGHLLFRNHLPVLADVHRRKVLEVDAVHFLSGCGKELDLTGGTQHRYRIEVQDDGLVGTEELRIGGRRRGGAFRREFDAAFGRYHSFAGSADAESVGRTGGKPGDFGIAVHSTAACHKGTPLPDIPAIGFRALDGIPLNLRGGLGHSLDGQVLRRSQRRRRLLRLTAVFAARKQRQPGRQHRQ